MTDRLRVVNAELPEPPYAADTRAKGWRFDLDAERIEASDTWALANDEQKRALLMLWYRAWQQIPCGSFPDDDGVIAARIGLPLAAFQVWRTVLMRGWIKHSDGRLYHPVIAERVLTFVKSREDMARRQREARERRAKEKERLAQLEGSHAQSHDVTRDSPARNARLTARSRPVTTDSDTDSDSVFENPPYPPIQGRDVSWGDRGEDWEVPQ